jgi:hypothetical protein
MQPLKNETWFTRKYPQGKTLVVHLHDHSNQRPLVTMVTVVTVRTFVSLAKVKGKELRWGLLKQHYSLMAYCTLDP